MRAWVLLSAGAALVLVAGCANGESYGRLDAGDAARADAPVLDGGGRDAPGGSDAPGLDAPSAPSDAGADAGRLDAGTDAPSGGGLDPSLDTPPASAPPCSTIGAFCTADGGAPGICRFYSATEGRCESCTTCGNLWAPCTDGTECDILFVCYLGQCTNTCTPGSFECGPPAECIDVGHADHGACLPH